MKILFISHDSDLTGAELCLYDLVTRLDRTEIEPLVVFPHGGPLVEKCRAAGIPTLIRCVAMPWIPYSRDARVGYFLDFFRGWRARIWSLLKLLETMDIDLVYTNTTIILDGAIAARKARIPHIWHVHEHLKGNPDLFSFLPCSLVSRIMLALSERLIVPSNALKNERFSVGLEKIDVVPNGIEVERFSCGDRDKIRKTLGIKAQSPVITFIASLSETKDPITLIIAASIVVKERPDTHLLIIGNTQNEELLAKVTCLVNNFGIASNCHFLGPRHDVEDLLASATVHVSTSLREVLARNILEAMAAGKPVVATKCGGSEEVVVHGETGFIVNPRDPSAMAYAILALINDSRMAERFGNAGRLLAYKLYTLKAHALRISAIIEEIVSQ